MKRILLVGLTIAVLSLGTGFAIPALAHGPTEGDSETTDYGTWQVMHEACEEGDWEAMVEAAEEAHGEDFSSMPYHDEDDYSSNNGWGGMMGGGMMGGGWGGMR